MNNNENMNNTNNTPNQVNNNTPNPASNNAPVQNPLNIPPVNSEPVEIPNVPAGTEEVTVVNTERKKTSNVIMVILIALLIAFVINIDKVIEYYENYTSTGSLTNKTDNENTNNLIDGFVLIGDSTSRVVVDKIIFYNFKRKEDSMSIIYNYESSAKYDAPSNLKIYVELYNSSKEMIYRELFDVKDGIEKDTVRIANLSIPADVYQDAYYALARKYTETEIQKTETLTCRFTDNSGDTRINHSIIFTFKNYGLTSYIVNKQLYNYDESGLLYKGLENEYKNVSKSLNAVFQGGNLNYTVNLEKDLNGFEPLYAKDTLMAIVKNKETLKKWVCE